MLVLVELEAQISHCFICSSNDLGNLTVMLNALLSQVCRLFPFTTSAPSCTINLCFVTLSMAISPTGLCGYICVMSAISSGTSTRLCLDIGAISSAASTGLCGYICVIWAISSGTSTGLCGYICVIFT